MQCGHDEHAPNHALAVVVNDYDCISITGAKCKCGPDDFWCSIYDSCASYGDDFSVIAKVVYRDRRTPSNYHIRRNSGRLTYTAMILPIDCILSANRHAEYHRFNHERLERVHRVGYQNKETLLKSVYTEYDKCTDLHISAAFDDSMLMSLGNWSTYPFYKQKMCLVDIATDRVIRSVSYKLDIETSYNQIITHGPNTWITRLINRYQFDMLDNRVEDMRVATYTLRTHTIYERGDLSSCVGDLILMKCSDFEDYQPSFVSVLDTRNSDRYDLASVCNNAHLSHLQL